MAYSDNLMPMDPSWMFRNAFSETFFPDTFSRETETFAKALQKSLETQALDNMNFSGKFMSPWLNSSDTAAAASTQTPTASGGSAENENISAAVAVVTSKPRRNGAVAGGKISKRKSRASKRSTTTFINADAANFRQLVQQVTGIKIGGGSGFLSSVGGGGGGGQLLKPEPHRAVNRLQLIGGGGGLPTLDTSAFLLDPTHQNTQNHQVGPASAMFNQLQGGEVLPEAASESPSHFDFDSFCSFPTLESWKAI